MDHTGLKSKRRTFVSEQTVKMLDIYFDTGKHFIIPAGLHRHTFEDEIPALGK